MRPRLIAPALAVALLAAVSCGPRNVLEEGEVIGKDYDDPDSWWTSMCVAYNKDGWCSVSIPVEEHDGPHWFLQIVGDDKDGKRREEWHEVTQTFHDEVDGGQYVHLADESIVPR